MSANTNTSKRFWLFNTSSIFFISLRTNRDLNPCSSNSGCVQLKWPPLQTDRPGSGNHLRIWIGPTTRRARATIFYQIFERNSERATSGKDESGDVKVCFRHHPKFSCPPSARIIFIFLFKLLNFAGASLFRETDDTTEFLEGRERRRTSLPMRWKGEGRERGCGWLSLRGGEREEGVIERQSSHGWRNPVCSKKRDASTTAELSKAHTATLSLSLSRSFALSLSLSLLLSHSR